MFGNHRAKMKNRQGTEGAPCYFSTLYTVITPIEGVTPWRGPYPSCGPEINLVILPPVVPPGHHGYLGHKGGLLDPYGQGPLTL